MRILVTGGRNYADYAHVVNTLNAYLVNDQGRYRAAELTLVQGGASGADRLAARWAQREGVRVEAFPADWDAPCRPACRKGHRRLNADGGSDYCPAAGMYRNQAMLDSGIDLVVAFAGGRGTGDMCRRAEAAGVRVVYA